MRILRIKIMMRMMTIIKLQVMIKVVGVPLPKLEKDLYLVGNISNHRNIDIFIFMYM